MRPSIVPEHAWRWSWKPGGSISTDSNDVGFTGLRDGGTVYLFDPLAPPESAKLLPRPYHTLTCPKRDPGSSASPSKSEAEALLAAREKKEAAKPDAKKQEAVGDNMQVTRARLLKDVSVFKELLGVGQKLREKASSETDPGARTKAIKVAGNAYTALVALSRFWGLHINIASTTGEAETRGVSAYPAGSRLTGRSPLDKLLRGFEDDKAIEDFYRAALAADVKAMNNAFADASLAYQLHLQGLDPWVRAIDRGAFRSQQIIAIADSTGDPMATVKDDMTITSNRSTLDDSAAGHMFFSLFPEGIRADKFDTNSFCTETATLGELW